MPHLPTLSWRRYHFYRMMLWLCFLPVLLLVGSLVTPPAGATTQKSNNSFDGTDAVEGAWRRGWWAWRRRGVGVCNRNSPHHLYYSEIQPRLVAILDEASQYTVSTLTKLEVDLEKFEESGFASPIKDVGGNHHLLKVRNHVLGHLKHAFELLDVAWTSLLRVNEDFLNEGCGAVEDVKMAAQRVHEATSTAESLLQMVLQDLKATVRAIVYNGLFLLQDATSPPPGSDPKEEEEEEVVAARMTARLPKVAPGLLGRLMTKVLRTGGDLKNFAKTPTAFLLPLLQPLLQVIDDLALLPDDPRHLERLWETAILESDVRLKEDPIFHEDLEAIYENEIYLSEVTLSLLATL